MRKLMTKEEERKKQKRNQTVVGIILIGVLVLSVFGMFANSLGDNGGNEDTQATEYNGYTFVNQNQMWISEIGEKELAINNNPSEIEEEFIENIKYEGDLKKIEEYPEKTLYLYSEDPMAKNKMYMNFHEDVSRMQEACPDKSIYENQSELENTECDENLPIKDCSENFIIIKKSDSSSTESKIVQKENCLVITGSPADLPKLTDIALLEMAEV